MSKRKLIVGILLILGMAVLMACAPKSAPAPSSASQVPASAPAAAPAPAKPAASTVPARPAWEKEWETVLNAAKKEERVALFITGGSDIRIAVSKVAGLQGLKAEIVTVRGPEDLLPKVLAERRAGLYLWDLYIGGPNAVVMGTKPAGLMERMDSALILPDITDPEVIKKVWYQGKLPWCDQDHAAFIFALQPGLAIAINTNLVKPDEVKSWRDLLNPKWKEKLALNDPTVGGSGQVAIQGMVGIMGEDYVRELAKAEPMIMRDQRQQLDWLAHGKISVLIGPKPDLYAEFVKVGAPIKCISLAEGIWLSAGAGAFGMFNRAPHPNAARVFINSLTTKEGQTYFALAGGYHSTRLDVTTSHLPPEIIRVEGAKYFDSASEEAFLARPVTNKLAKDVFGPLLK